MASAPPASGAPGRPMAETGALVVSYSARLWRTILALLPSSDSKLLKVISDLFSGIFSSRGRQQRRGGRQLRESGLPLPLHFHSVETSLATIEASRVLGILDDILNHVLSSLHIIHKSLQFWESRAEGTYGQKVYFMVFERGPKAFVKETIHLIGRRRVEGSSMQHLYRSAAMTISEKISVLTSLQSCLARFLAEIYTEVDKYGEGVAVDLEKLLPSLLMAINGLFTGLEASIGHSKEIYKSDLSFLADGCDSSALLFEKIPEIHVIRSQWTDTEISNAINLIYQNLNRLDSYISFVVSKCQKPSRMNLYWLQYTCGAVGLSLCTIWLLRHSRLMGSSDIDNWVREAKESTNAFWKSHVEQPLLSIRDELFETFRRRHKGVIEHEDVQLSANSLHRMLLAFSEQTKGQKFPEDASDQEMLEIVMSRYEKELMHPLQNLIGGELPRALLIQVQKLKLDVETAMLELDQILKANEINFAILAALPAFFLSVLLVMLVRAWLRKDKGAEGRGRAARIQRRLLVVDVEKKIMQFQMCMDQGLEEDARCIFGLVLYQLDRLYKAVEGHAKATSEWSSLKRDIIDLGKPGLPTPYKLALTSRIGHVYDCMLPSPRRV
ncbi:unnamed protein product [Spirodela intermedia]|uniref:Uncharacterized protein n=1 Tax=Spirodela intermedia TaxID=51605 RepID=A0A7I8JZ84_SPIIN|nr:unnamed protein product [Spirodela intermedia]